VPYSMIVTAQRVTFRQTQFQETTNAGGLAGCAGPSHTFRKVTMNIDELRERNRKIEQDERENPVQRESLESIRANQRRRKEQRERLANRVWPGVDRRDYED